MMSIVALDDENAAWDISSSNGVNLVSPSVLSNLYFSLVIVPKLKKGMKPRKFRSIF